MNAIAQTSPNYTRANDSPAAPAESSREQVIARLIAEVKAGRVLITEQRAGIAALDRQVQAEKAGASSLADSYELAKREIESLRRSISHLERAVQLHEQTIALLTERNAELKAQAKKNRKRAVIGWVVAAGVVALKLL